MKYKRRKYRNDTIGDLDKRLTFVQTTDVSEDGWEESVNTIFHKCWAELIESKGRDYNMAVQTGTVNQMQFRIRFKDGITTDMNVIYKNENYTVKDLIGADPRDAYMIVVLERKTL